MIELTLRSSVTLVLEMDPAVGGDYHAYWEGGCDESKLTFSGVPTRFTLQRLTYDQRQHAQDIVSSSDRREFILRCALTDVKDLQVRRDGGAIVDADRPTFEDAPRWGRPLLKREWLQHACLPTAVVVELAAAAMVLSEGNIPFPVA